MVTCGHPKGNRARPNTPVSLEKGLRAGLSPSHPPCPGWGGTASGLINSPKADRPLCSGGLLLNPGHPPCRRGWAGWGCQMGGSRWVLEPSSPSGALRVPPGVPGMPGCVPGRRCGERGVPRRCLLSLLFLAGTPVPLNASPEALPTVQLSNASLAFRPGS